MMFHAEPSSTHGSPGSGRALLLTLTFGASVLVLPACGGASDGPPAPAPNTAPVAVLKLTPARGKLPLQVTADASGSTDHEQDASTLEVRWDLEGRGTFDGAFAALSPVSRLYYRPGSFPIRAEVRDREGLVSVATATVVVLPSADLRADLDRDGQVTDLDDDGEESFAQVRGAVILANLDDDDGDQKRDGEDAVVNGDADRAELAPLVVRQYPGLDPARDQVTLAVSDEAAAEVRVFREDASGAMEVLWAPIAHGAPVALPAADVAAGDVLLWVEAVSGRNASWDGNVTFTLSVEHAGETDEDVVAMRCAPVIFPDNLQAPELLYVMHITDPELGENSALYGALQAALPAGVELYAVDQYRYQADRWVQDNMQTGYQQAPGAEGLRVVPTYLETDRPTGADGLEWLLTRELVGPGQGYVFPGGVETSLNYGGNLEIAPPHTANGNAHPLGRILVGGGALGLLDGRAYEDHMTQEQRDFLAAQGVQGPPLELSTEWLAVGHLDEIFQFVPATTSTTAHPFRVVLASPALARRALEALSAEGQGGLAVFAGRNEETTVDAILADQARMTWSDAAQARIDTVREVMEAELGLTDADFVEVPVLYEPVTFGRDRLAVAYDPGIQNLVTLGTTLIVPDPEGPVRADGTDPWKEQTRAALEPLGLDVRFVDVFESYHVNMGEAHCGTEVRRSAYPLSWWRAE